MGSPAMTDARSTTITVYRCCGRSRSRYGRRPTTSLPGYGGSTWSAFFWQSTISAVATSLQRDGSDTPLGVGKRVDARSRATVTSADKYIVFYPPEPFGLASGKGRIGA